MKSFFSFFALETKRFFSKKTTAIFLVFLILVLFLVQIGINEYKKMHDNKNRFQEMEKIKVQEYINYSQYGAYGFQLLFLPSPLSVFFNNSSMISELNANIDTLLKLNIYSTFKGRALFANRSGTFKDMAGIILLFGTFLTLYFGYDSFRFKDYLKFIASLSNHKTAYYSIIFSRLILLNAFFLMIVACCLLLLRVNGVSLVSTEWYAVMAFGLLMIFILSFFFVIGTIISSFKSKINAIITIISCWFIFVFLIPGAINTFISEKANDITSHYQVELNKLKIIMDFENKAIEKEGAFKIENRQKQSEREIIERFWEIDLKKIESIEEQLKNEMEQNIDIYHKISMFFPTSFYLSTANEIGSRGYKSFVGFYSYVQNLKRQFIRFYINKRFYDQNYSEIESFVKGDENIFYAWSQLPGNFSTGLALNLFYIFVLIGISYFRIRKLLFGLPDRKYQELADLELELESGRTEVLLTSENRLIGQVYNFFSGRDNGFKGQVLIDNKNMSGKGIKKDFIYVCHPNEIPNDIKVGDFIRFISRIMRISRTEMARLYVKLDLEKIEKKTFGELKDIEKGRLILTTLRLKERKIYIIHDLASGMSVDFAVEAIEGLKELEKKQGVILYITLDVLFAAKIADRLTYLITDPTIPRRIDDYKKM